MTFKRILSATALFGAASCSVAMAADLPARTAPPVFAPVLVSGWDGVYVGSTYGYGFTNFRTSQGSTGTRSESGQSGGALAGYNFQYGHWVFGPEVGIDLNVIRGTIPGKVGLNPSRLDTLDDLRIRGRIGYEFGWIMPFIAGGAVINETYQSTPSPTNFFGEDKRTVGYTIGGGVDVKLNPSSILPFLPSSLFGPLILRGEYLHDELPRETYTLFPGAGGTYRTSSDTNLFRIAIIYRFGDVAPRPYADALGNVNWGGGYGGLFGGYSDVDVKNRLAGFGSTKTTADGGLGGIYAGTNFMFFNNRLMLGFDGSTSLSDITGHGTEPGFGGRLNFREYVQADLRARVGYAFGNFLPFVAGGVIFTRSEQKDLLFGTQQGRIPSDGFTIGGGLDYRISQRVSLRGEYLYETNYNHKLVNLTGVPFKEDRNANVVRFGAAYHFE